MSKFEFRDVENKEKVLSLWMNLMVEEDGEQHIRLMSKYRNKPNAGEYVEAVIDEHNVLTPIAGGNLNFANQYDVLYRCSKCMSACNYGFNLVREYDDIKNYAPPVNCICNISIRPDWVRIY